MTHTFISSIGRDPEPCEEHEWIADFKRLGSTDHLHHRPESSVRRHRRPCGDLAVSIGYNLSLGVGLKCEVRLLLALFYVLSNVGAHLSPRVEQRLVSQAVSIESAPALFRIAVQGYSSLAKNKCFDDVVGLCELAQEALREIFGGVVEGALLLNNPGRGPRRAQHLVFLKAAAINAPEDRRHKSEAKGDNHGGGDEVP